METSQVQVVEPNSNNNSESKNEYDKKNPESPEVEATDNNEKNEETAAVVVEKVGKKECEEQNEEQRQENENTKNEEATVNACEDFKAEIRNLPRNFGFGQFRKYLNSLNLKALKLKAPPRNTFAFVTFADEATRAHALEVLNKSKYQGKELEAVAKTDKPAAPNKRSVQEEEEAVKQRKLNELVPLEERMQNSTTPLWKLSYDEQVEKKSETMKALLKKYAVKIEKVNTVAYYWLKKQKLVFDGMPCELEETVKSPVTEGYRNKCEFTIGYNKDQTKQVIGFRMGDFKSGIIEVAEPFACKVISESMKSFVKKFQEYIDQSKYKAHNVIGNTGHWSQLTLRSNQENDLLAIVIFNKVDLSEEEIAREKLLLSSFFRDLQKDTEKEQDFKLSGLLFNLNDKIGMSKMENLDLLVGQDVLYETLFDLKFRISPLAFFQSNSKGAELLYTKIGDICSIDKETIVLDICCGTGTIGLTLANRAKLVVGVEIIPEAIADAKLNSKLNNITNIEWHCGKAEDVLPGLLQRFTDKKVIAILDPPRAGVHSKVVQSLRRLKNLESLVYVSCNPELAMSNFIDFSRESSKTYHYQGFVPQKAIAVDMFPHTSHCELIVYMKRYSTDLLNDLEATKLPSV